tara:strand:- start:42 stop:296 length:255 start_codon:yes stop_codon:yes gene_type:complete
MDLKYIETVVKQGYSHHAEGGQSEDQDVKILEEEIEEITTAISKMEQNVEAGCRALRKLETVREALKEKINSLLAQQKLPLEDN